MSQKIQTVLLILKFLVNATYEKLMEIKAFFVLFHYNSRVNIFCKKILKCDIKYISTMYAHMGSEHIEYLPRGGIFIENAHKLYYSKCLVHVVSPIKQDLEYIKLRMFASPSKFEQILANPYKNRVVVNAQYDSASVLFLLERLKSRNEILDFFTNLKRHIRQGGVIFGVTVLGDSKGVRHSGAAKKLIANRNADGIWHNENNTIEYMSEIFKMIFPKYTISIKGSCLMFHCYL